MRISVRATVRVIAFALAAPFVSLSALAAQDIAPQELSSEKLTAYAKAYAEIGQVREAFQARLAASPSKTLEAQKELRETLKQTVAEIIEKGGLTEAEYRRITWIISIDPQQRDAFEQILARITTEKTSDS
jgi:hypothetical protein